MTIDSSQALAAPPTRTPEPSPTVRVKACCGVLAGEVCDCRAFAAEARGVFATGRVIVCRPASEWSV